MQPAPPPVVLCCLCCCAIIACCRLRSLLVSDKRVIWASLGRWLERARNATGTSGALGPRDCTRLRSLLVRAPTGRHSDGICDLWEFFALVTSAPAERAEGLQNGPPEGIWREHNVGKFEQAKRAPPKSPSLRPLKLFASLPNRSHRIDPLKLAGGGAH